MGQFGLHISPFLDGLLQVGVKWAKLMTHPNLSGLGELCFYGLMLSPLFPSLSKSLSGLAKFPSLNSPLVQKLFGSL